MTLGQQLRKLREEKGYSQETLSARVADVTDVTVSAAAISRIERDRFLPSLTTLQAYARALGVVFRVGGKTITIEKGSR